MPRLGSAFAGITAALFLGVAGCPSDDPDPLPTSSATPEATDLKAASGRWTDLSSSQRETICAQALGAEDPDYRGMLHALVDTGLSQPDAAAMLPYAVNECV